MLLTQAELEYRLDVAEGRFRRSHRLDDLFDTRSMAGALEHHSRRWQRFADMDRLIRSKVPRLTAEELVDQRLFS
ncbi:MAG: hypothetical protein OXU42_07610 [Deltaproteobacteria bacterium]|nr:hypothetical protein [Deltaproteobacteria bacterium]